MSGFSGRRPAETEKLNRVKWFFKVMQGMSSDRPRAVRYTENIRKRQAWKHLFRRSSVPSCQDWNTAEHENLQQLPSPDPPGPRESTNRNCKNQAARPLKNTSGGNRRAQPSLSYGGMACALRCTCHALMPACRGINACLMPPHPRCGGMCIFGAHAMH